MSELRFLTAGESHGPCLTAWRGASRATGAAAV